jgi:hypothetical protein
MKGKGRLTAADIDDNSDKVIDLASTQKEAQDESKTYICSECGKDLVLDTTYRLRNPYGGEGYYCSNINKCSMFGKVLDISIEKLKVKPRPVKGAISNLRDASQESIIETIAEDKGLQQPIEDEYDKYNPEPFEDELLKAQGATIIESRIELTDSSGMNRTIVKRNK